MRQVMLVNLDMDSRESMSMEGIQQKESFKDVVNGTNRGFPTMDLILEQLQEDIDGEIQESDTTLKVSFTMEQLQLLRAPWSKALIGKVLGTKLRYDAIVQRLPALWKPQGKLDIIDLVKHIFLFRFDLQLDLDQIMIGALGFYLDTA